MTIDQAQQLNEVGVTLLLSVCVPMIFMGALIIVNAIRPAASSQPLNRLPYGSCGHCGGKPEIVCARVGCPMEG